MMPTENQSGRAFSSSPSNFSPSPFPSDGETLKSFMTHWPPKRRQEYEPLLSYFQDNGVRLVARGTPLQVLCTVQSEGIRGLAKADHQKYAILAGSGFIFGINPHSHKLLVDMISLNQTSIWAKFISNCTVKSG